MNDGGPRAAVFFCGRGCVLDIPPGCADSQRQGAKKAARLWNRAALAQA